MVKIVCLLAILITPSRAFSACPPSHTQNTAHVFGIDICAEQSVPQWAMDHAVTITSEYLDNDEDGGADHPDIENALRHNKAVLVLFRDQTSAENFDFETIENRIGQDLYVTEMHPDGRKHQLFDASLEEILHLITHAGYESLYPDIFGTHPGTAVSKAMDKARGGMFLTIPRSYPQKAWYSYDDPTCDYACQAGEYIYWALTSYLGAQKDAWRQGEIAEEWRAPTPEKLRQMDPDIVKIIENPVYHLPQNLPDGHYALKPNEENTPHKRRAKHPLYGR